MGSGDGVWGMEICGLGLRVKRLGVGRASSQIGVQLQPCCRPCHASPEKLLGLGM